MVNKQLTRTEPIFWVRESCAARTSTYITYHVKRGYYMSTVEAEGSVKYAVSPWESGILAFQVDPNYVFLTMEEANAFIKKLEETNVESN